MLIPRLNTLWATCLISIYIYTIYIYINNYCARIAKCLSEKVGRISKISSWDLVKKGTILPTEQPKLEAKMIRGKWKEVYWLERGKNEIIQFLRLDASRFSWNVSKRYVTALRIIELSFHASHPTGICSPVRVCPSPCERISARTYRPRLRTMHR